MRECLGWLTNCSNEQACPQNWLEHAVTEVPLEVMCHVCGRGVSLVGSAETLEQQASRGHLAAFPIVPPVALDGAPGPSTGLPPPREAPAERFPEAPKSAPDPVRAPTPVPSPRMWVCTLQNGETIRIDKDAMVIGRSRTCDIVIPSAKVSRQHASLTRTGGELWIEDLGSANGVWHDGEKVTRTKISNGATFTISDETLLFEVR
jgi:hypothetical protein